tara:strand:- start:236 stop:562 length:327 start_codon:yes stop_codon:yes gene_type:complete
MDEKSWACADFFSPDASIVLLYIFVLRKEYHMFKGDITCYMKRLGRCYKIIIEFEECVVGFREKLVTICMNALGYVHVHYIQFPVQLQTIEPDLQFQTYNVHTIASPC